MVSVQGGQGMLGTRAAVWIVGVLHEAGVGEHCVSVAEAWIRCLVDACDALRNMCVPCPEARTIPTPGFWILQEAGNIFTFDAGSGCAPRSLAVEVLGMS